MRTLLSSRRDSESSPVSLEPDGYETKLGRWFWEDGFVPSQGQRVRLALARALFRPADLVVLDEPTLGLDLMAERAVVAQIAALAAARTLVVISHRLVFREIASHVICLEDGRVVTEGSADEVTRRVSWFEGNRVAVEEVSM